jgi:dihydropteroate synthase
MMEEIHSFFSATHTLSCRGKLIDLSAPLVMGVINVSPDSFYSGSRFKMKYRIYRRAKEILNQGGKIIDIGACSTRPGSKPVSDKEEIKRLSKALAIVRKHFPEAIVSVDTFRASIAKRVVEDFAVNIINDISAGEMDKNMHETVAKLNVPYIVMHMKGTPQNMQNDPKYDDVVKELFSFFSNKINELNLLGINDILIDPGFGFGKSLEHNYCILKNLDSFRILNIPIVVGLSRKSMIYKPLELKPENALNGTTILNTIALLNGAKILRVHDVMEAVQAIKLVSLTQIETIAE